MIREKEERKEVGTQLSWTEFRDKSEDDLLKLYEKYDYVIFIRNKSVFKVRRVDLCG